MTYATINIQGEHLQLLPERAAYWERTQTLFVADVHLGKAATFRAYKVPVPEGSMAADLTRLSQALQRTSARQLIILGDLFHNVKGRDQQTHTAFSNWRQQHPDLKLTLISGNHDRKAGDLLAEWNIRIVEGPTPGPLFVLNHAPLQPTAGYALTGHVHPAVKLLGQGLQSAKLPCFWFRENSAVLPAFGDFIDHMIVQPEKNDQVFAVTKNQVLSVRDSD